MRVKKIAIVGSPSISPNTTTSETELLSIIAAVRAKFDSPIEVEFVNAVGLGAVDSKVIENVDAVILASNQPSGNWLRKLGSPVLLVAPFLPVSMKGVFRSLIGQMVWTFEESTQMHTQPGQLTESIIETQVLTRVAVENLWLSAQAVASERSASSPTWVYCGWAAIDDFSVRVGKSLLHSEVRVLGIEQFQALSPGEVVACVARTALPLARLLRVPGWIAKPASGPLVLQQSQADGAPLLAYELFDQLGLRLEAAEIQKKCEAYVKAGTPQPQWKIFNDQQI